MAASAQSLITGAMGAGYAGLSARQCAMCLLYVYGSGLTAQQLMDGAAAQSYQALSSRDLEKCLLEALQ